MKGLLFDASRYQETLDPTRPATFQTVSLGTWVNKGNQQTLTLSLLVVPQQVESGTAGRDA